MKNIRLRRHPLGLQGEVQWNYTQDWLGNSIGVADLFSSSRVVLPNSQLFGQGKLYECSGRTGVNQGPDFFIIHMWSDGLRE